MGRVCAFYKFGDSNKCNIPNGSANFNQLYARIIILSVYLNKLSIRGIVNFSKDSICRSYSCCCY